MAKNRRRGAPQWKHDLVREMCNKMHEAHRAINATIVAKREIDGDAKGADAVEMVVIGAATGLASACLPYILANMQFPPDPAGYECGQLALRLAQDFKQAILAVIADHATELCGRHKGSDGDI